MSTAAEQFKIVYEQFLEVPDHKVVQIIIGHVRFYRLPQSSKIGLKKCRFICEKALCMLGLLTRIALM